MTKTTNIVTLSRRALAGAFAALAFALSLLTSPAFAVDDATAQKFQSARAAGLVGEQVDGYAAFVKPNGDVELKRVLNEVNAARRETYTQIAQANGQSVDAAAQVAAKTNIERLPAGIFVRDSSGQWKQK